MPRDIKLLVNGETHTVNVDPDTPLIYVLRNDLGLKAAKLACGLEQCGACKVIVDGQAVPSCRLPVRNVQGLSITTLEGLGTAQDLHPLQQAFIDEQALQCGYCTPGMIVTARALLGRRRHPTDEEIRAALGDDLCRCGVYDRVLRAIKRTIGRPRMEPSYERQEGAAPAAEAPSGELPYSLRENRDLDAWVRINSGGTVTLFSGKVELGQGLRTAIAQIGAEELEVSLERVEVVMGDTGQTPDEGVTAGSMSLETSGNAIRIAAAEARARLLALASDALDAPVGRLTVKDGTITDPATGHQTTYWALMGGRKFEYQVQGDVPTRRPETYTVVGRPAPRVDLLDKVTGTPCFVQDLELPGMVHGRVLRPPSYGARLTALEQEVASRRPGVLQVVRDGSFVGVIAEREDQAVKVIDFLRETAVWEEQGNLPGQERLMESMLRQPDQPLLVVDGVPVDDPIPPIAAPKGAARTLNATYFRPYQMHASLGPSAAVAQLVDGELTVWSHTQGVYLLRGAIAQVLGMDPQAVRVIHMEGPGCYGHNGADDAALDAALLARAVPGRPVALKWSRGDEHAWEPYGTATVLKLQASLDDDGAVIDWNHDVWGYSHFGRPHAGEPVSGLVAAQYLEAAWPAPEGRPSRGSHVGIHRNADPFYAFPQRRIVKHFLPHSPLRTSSLRSLGAYANVFAIESFMDELAHAAGADPLDFRLRHLTDARAQAVLRAAADKAGWPLEKSGEVNDRGRGIAFARYKNRQCYAAVVADVRVNRESGQILLERAVVAADAGQVVNPDGLSNQLEGGLVQSASWALKEQVTFDAYGVVSVDWYSYPILRAGEAPVLETVLLDQPGSPYLGSGEAVVGPAAAAIANAVFDAVGVRLRELPFTPERVLAALRAG
jgi:nicotinate dehydrogenase subunit B